MNPPPSPAGGPVRSAQAAPRIARHRTAQSSRWPSHPPLSRPQALLRPLAHPHPIPFSRPATTCRPFPSTPLRAPSPNPLCHYSARWVSLSRPADDAGCPTFDIAPFRASPQLSLGGHVLSGERPSLSDFRRGENGEGDGTRTRNHRIDGARPRESSWSPPQSHVLHDLARCAGETAGVASRRFASNDRTNTYDRRPQLGKLTLYPPSYDGRPADQPHPSRPTVHPLRRLLAAGQPGGSSHNT